MRKILIKANYITRKGEWNMDEIKFDAIVIVGITALAVGSWWVFRS